MQGELQGSAGQSPWPVMEFLAIMSDYLSMLILLPHPPQDCPSVNHNNVREFLLHTFLFPNKPLYQVWDSTQDSDRVKDRNGVPMITQGGKESPTSFNNMFSALRILHSNYAEMENCMYCRQCQSCLELCKLAKTTYILRTETETEKANRTRFRPTCIESLYK